MLEEAESAYSQRCAVIVAWTTDTKGDDVVKYK
jgi:hypothetical protein